VQYLAWGNGIEQVNYCTRPTAEWNSSLDYFHHRRPNILNYCNHIHQITVLLHNHTFHEEIQHNLVWFSETISLIGFDWSLSHDYLPNVKCVKKKNNKSVVPLLLLSCIDCIYIYIRLKIKPNSVRIRSLSCQILFFPRRDLNSHHRYTAAPIA
jgi:hypothetical protein